MIDLKGIAKRVLAYTPLPETKKVRQLIVSVSRQGRPFCPPFEGDLMYSLIREGGYSKCLETGFHTGSSAIYMAAAVADRDGQVTSICLDDETALEEGKFLVKSAGYEPQHRLIHKNSNRALAELFLAGERFDFIFMDGWKTFDHLAFEMYYFNQVLNKGGVVMFDDCYLPSVRKAIRLMKRYYGYTEVEYSRHNQSFRLRIWSLLTYRTAYRPYRALKKKADEWDQPPFQDWTFYRPV